MYSLYTYNYKKAFSLPRIMAFLSLYEIFDIILMSLVVGWIFKDLFKPKFAWKSPDEYLKNVTPGVKNLKMNDFWFAVLLVAPSIILHEFGHKLIAMSFGLDATFHAAYKWLVIAILLKMFLGFIFFVPAYVSFPAIALPWQSALIAFAGPAVNGLLYLGTLLYMKYSKRKHGKEMTRFLILFKRINGFLFVFNMIPIPGFDGFHVLSSLAKMVF